MMSDEARQGGLHRWAGRSEEAVPPTFCVSLLRMPEETAKRRIMGAGLACRVLRRDGVPRIATRECNFRRINLHIENGIVTSATTG